MNVYYWTVICVVSILVTISGFDDPETLEVFAEPVDTPIVNSSIKPLDDETDKLNTKLEGVPDTSGSTLVMIEEETVTTKTHTQSCSKDNTTVVGNVANSTQYISETGTIPLDLLSQTAISNTSSKIEILSLTEKPLDRPFKSPKDLRKYWENAVMENLTDSSNFQFLGGIMVNSSLYADNTTKKPRSTSNWRKSASRKRRRKYRREGTEEKKNFSTSMYLLPDSRVTACYACTTLTSRKCASPESGATIKYCADKFKSEEQGNNFCVKKVFPLKGGIVLIRDCASDCDSIVLPDIPDDILKITPCLRCFSDLCNGTFFTCNKSSPIFTLLAIWFVGMWINF